MTARRRRTYVPLFTPPAPFSEQLLAVIVLTLAAVSIAGLFVMAMIKL